MSIKNIFIVYFGSVGFLSSVKYVVKIVVKYDVWLICVYGNVFLYFEYVFGLIEDFFDKFGSVRNEKIVVVCDLF